MELGDEIPLPTEALDAVTCVEGRIFDQRRALNDLNQQLNKPRILRGLRSSEYLKNRFDHQVKTLHSEVEHSAAVMQSTTNRFQNYTAMVADANRILRSTPVRV